ncbi:MAG: carbohydrate-binding protein SusD [Bacteroidetes bacterium GWF2_42_66]|nr:MAG: carbohydrate-binding protein SusD [Bacteroidetes bacterium GWA2_42_15]OFX99769.1 MAG: carbohydrate-binding protein SusD [Bacteroidetes bacterium GWE2_42_39]OFY39807.1 MAG: carbohydrate-binding protein SusD [Bacteroidetes bacterium GWF2_42_66]HBL74793.1 RagB/SusD family nutrient uptake outer membrane protein [Prolixibacteraceae bacterium]HCR90755.1 RagB/SusD family nutrient uptake outer membrane protein [Prolixibacteraceae bacterium]
MKKYIMKIYWLLFATFFILSCNDSFLERYPLDEISSETFWKTENDLIVYNNSLYDLSLNDDNVPMMMGHSSGSKSHTYSIWYQDEFSDNIVTINTRHLYYQQVRAGLHSIPSAPTIYGYQGWYFIRACNVGLDHYDNADITDEIKNKYKAEARLMRGWFYAEKVSKFGDVPWVEHELNVDSEELYAARTPRETVMEKVLADLSFACEHLPEDWGDGRAPGRLNRWCALAVKSRVCLFEGTWRKYHGGTNSNMWLQEAANAAKELIEKGPYRIYSTGDPKHDYNAYQRATSLDGNSEVIYWRKYESGTYMNHIVNYHKKYQGGATKSMVDDYLCSDGLPITLSPLYKGDAKIEDVFENRDPRLRQTVLHPEDQAYYNYDNSTAYTYPRFTGMTGGLPSLTGYHLIKNWDAVASVAAMGTSITPAIQLRLGEVMLNYAEAKAELGTITQIDLDVSINKLRDRVAMPHLNLNNVPVDLRYVNDGVSPLIVEIRRERRVELFMEGFRYNDLRRWKQGKKLEIPSMGILWDNAAKARYPKAKVGTSVDPISGKTYIRVYSGTEFANPVFNETKHYLWPIPLNAISQNPNLGQNPGWN